MGQLSVDFVGTATQANGAVQWGVGGASQTVASTNFQHPEIGTLHQGIFTFAGVSAGARAWYCVTADSQTWSANYTIVPVVAVPRVAVFGDFGLSNDIIMAQLAADVKANLFDFVHHVGDFAYDMEEQQSSVGNQFMQLASQNYAATIPIACVPGNHEACGACPAAPGLDNSRGNFTQYRARFYSVQLAAGANSGSGSNIYYSLNLGLTHSASRPTPTPTARARTCSPTRSPSSRRTPSPSTARSRPGSWPSSTRSRTWRRRPSPQSTPSSTRRRSTSVCSALRALRTTRAVLCSPLARSNASVF